MDPALKLCALLVILLLVNDAFASDFGHCERVVKSWAYTSLDNEIREDKHTLGDLLFFLHVPRTGGRTYFHCFLKKLYPNSLECPRSYDKLRFDPRCYLVLTIMQIKPKCRLLVTHDDYSITSKLPKARTSVVTILRDPVDRVFSTYEFSIEVAARFLVHPNLTSATQMTLRLRSKTKAVSTLDIWPWKYLVPWMRQDLFERRDARRRNGQHTIEKNDYYDMEDFAMPLHEYINHPAARDIVHNGATFQVAGLTNNSYMAEAHEVRHCVQKYKILGKYVLQVAKKRLDNMLYVGLTEEHRESATMFANVVGAQVISQLNAPNTSLELVDKTEQSSVSDSDPDSSEHQNSTSETVASEVTSSDSGEATKLKMSAKELMGAYEGCISNLRKAQSSRRIASLKRISPVNFTKEARLLVSEEVLQEIRSLNDLDLELYEYARAIFDKQHKATMRTFTEQRWDNISSTASEITFWKFLPLAITFAFLILVLLLIVNVRRRTLKIK
ncbi:protein-tyrosine sulfotransferase isoform X1 [Arachis ipaensis]|uniref:protein-tyrosine sulfotransferase isoform X1 n=3 Tax=Arachis ipaensis TaxID=130454 RepID=UPI000A2B1E12|nr:protein-tyrosine sulfotransferase isoform X1 [Arachis ipaensis]XP_020964418.1 protein-tyrosine sulfotransferase isoform X1 [Arachis ipaensis]XP_029151036.1 protein-tyrosine sulfotransferase isoform X3 [Arachis hypogaea]